MRGACETCAVRRFSQGCTLARVSKCGAHPAPCPVATQRDACRVFEKMLEARRQSTCIGGQRGQSVWRGWVGIQSGERNCNTGIGRRDRSEIKQPPAQGSVSLRPGQTTTVASSMSGKCIGAKVQGTGIYYAASPTGGGRDTFSIRARLSSGETIDKTFQLRIED
jgi:hypothetical protein